MTTKTEGAHDVRKVLQSVKDHWAQVGHPKLSEADTRAHFIDPLLRSLGYRQIGDVQHEVFVESAKQYLDYQLVVDGTPRVAVEAKAIDVTLNDSHGAQVVQYCSVLGIEWAVVTNAREWRLYHGFAKGPLVEKQLSRLDLLSWETDGEFATVFEQLWLLSKEAFQSSAGPAAWLSAKQLDGILRKALTDPSSPELKYLRKRLSDQAISTSTEGIAAWFKVNIGGTTQPSSSPAVLPASVAAPPSSPTAPAAASSASAIASPSAGKKTSYFRLMLGSKSTYAADCLAGDFIGTDFGIAQDLSDELPDDWKAFNRKFVPIFLASHPDKKPVAAGLACGALWTVSRGLKTDDVVLCPNGKGEYLVGRIAGSYRYEPGGVLPHRRPVSWMDKVIKRSAMSAPLQHSAGSIGTISDISKHRDEIERLIAKA